MLCMVVRDKLISSQLVNKSRVCMEYKIRQLIYFHYFSTRTGIRQSVSDSLRSGWSGDRIPVGARLPTPVQTGPGAHPASCTVGAGSFPGVKRLVPHVNHLRPSRAEVKERVDVVLYSPSMLL